MSISNRIKEIIMDFIKEKYFDYLDDNNILLINNDNLKRIISNFYNNNTKELKNNIRNTLKKELASEYPSMTIENTLFDIFQDKSLNINRIILEIENYQNSISKNTQLKVFENNLGIKLNINDHVEIISAENPDKSSNNQDEIYNIINNYKYIYSINNKELSNLDTNIKISTVKEFVKNENILDLILVKDL
tara:strand:- start:2300 stop:2872 length:573 start_codon:yes stop_codon:yes gene_type:complete